MTVKPFCKTPPYGMERQGKEAMALFKDLASLVHRDAEKQKRRDNEIRKRVAEESRMIRERWREPEEDGSY
jgi:hypothetical protein